MRLREYLKLKNRIVRAIQAAPTFEEARRVALNGLDEVDRKVGGSYKQWSQAHQEIFQTAVDRPDY